MTIVTRGNRMSLVESQPRAHCLVVRIGLALLGGLLLTATMQAQDGYQVVSVSDAGKIVGRISWSGPIPHANALVIDKDREVCDPESHKTHDLQRLILGRDGGVANTVVFLKDISAGKAMNLLPQRSFLDQKRCQYEPHVLLVPAQGTLEMQSSDAVLHTIHMQGAATYNLPFPFPNQTTSRPMTNLGVVDVHCNGGHLWMNAEILVVAHPYYAVTDQTGRYELADVPPGEYEVTAWHEGWGVFHNRDSVDVLTQARVARPVFTEPRTWERKAVVKPDATSTVNFVISEGK
jgi:hypothetical protein